MPIYMIALSICLTEYLNNYAHAHLYDYTFHMSLLTNLYNYAHAHLYDCTSHMPLLSTFIIMPIPIHMIALSIIEPVYDKRGLLT